MRTKVVDLRWLSVGPSLVLGCLGFITAFCCRAQNLVPNHSFEEAQSCYPFSGFYYPDEGPLGWFSGGHSPDYFQGPDCAGYGNDRSASLNHMGFQYPFDGVCYAGVVSYYFMPPGREYLVIQLLEPLEIGQTYYASFRANAAWGGTAQVPYASLASSHIGMRFTMHPNQWVLDDPMPVPVNYAQVYYPQVLTDTVGWTFVSGSFVADSSYQYVMIGNHFSNSLTDTSSLGNTINPPMAYTFIDDVCVSPSPLGCPSLVGLEGHFGVDVVLFPNPSRATVVIRNVEQGARVSVVDLFGRNVWTGNTVSDTLRLNTEAWARGSYVLRLESYGKSHSFKFVLVD